jgi:hypothetical protein
LAVKVAVFPGGRECKSAKNESIVPLANPETGKSMTPRSSATMSLGPTKEKLAAAGCPDPVMSRQANTQMKARRFILHFLPQLQGPVRLSGGPGEPETAGYALLNSMDGLPLKKLFGEKKFWMSTENGD